MSGEYIQGSLFEPGSETGAELTPRHAAIQSALNKLGVRTEVVPGHGRVINGVPKKSRRVEPVSSEMPVQVDADGNPLPPLTQCA